MSIDFGSLIGATSPIHFARAIYNSGSEGTEVGKHNLFGEMLPAGALLVGAEAITTDDITFDGSGTLQLTISDTPLLTPDLTHDGIVSAWPPPDLLVPQSVDWPVQAVIADAPLLTGNLVVYLFYLASPKWPV